MRGRAPACFCACVRACVSATLPLLLDTRRSSFRPQHEPPLFLSFSKCAAPPLVLNTHRSSLTRPSCRKPFLFCDRAVQRLAPVTCRSRASGARDRVADLAEAAGARRCVLQSVTCPAQPGPADAAVATPLSSPPPLLLERRRTSWLRRPATCFPPLWPCPAEAPIYSLA